MKRKKLSKTKNKINKHCLSNANLKNIKSNYILSKLFIHLDRKKSLQLVKYNKKIQNRLHFNTKDYKEYSETFSSIEIEIIPCKDKYGQFININTNDRLYYHIYFNDNKKEIKYKYITKQDKVERIKIIIDYQVQSFEKLFFECKCIELINFKKFYRNNINNMIDMFRKCSSLKKLDFSNCNTNNVTQIYSMFWGCSSLEEINLSNFNTSNVYDMYGMFFGCSSLKELNLSSFNTKKVKNMSYMFEKCLLLKEINISSFNTENVENMAGMFDNCSSLIKLNISCFNTNNLTNIKGMFYKCSSLKELNLFNFNTFNVLNIRGAFYGCSNDLKNQIISEKKNINIEAFEQI